ncbi:hypothetical protein GW17_00036841 [Ensete ventricosum]|nr:hypothetical protein GW17_00036841 [Ensete ventricosum]
MSQECSALNNLGEDLPVTGQQAPIVAPPLPFSFLGDGSLISQTLGHYWYLFNDPGLTPPMPDLGGSTVTPEAFLGFTQQVQALVGMIQMIVPYIPYLAQPLSLQNQPTPIAPPRALSLREQPPAMQQPGNEPPQTLPEHNPPPIGDPTG